MKNFPDRLVVLGISALLIISFLNLDTAKYDTAFRVWLPLVLGVGIFLPALLLGFRGVRERPVLSLTLAGFCIFVWISWIFSQTKNYGFTEAIMYSFAALLGVSLTAAKKETLQILHRVILLLAIASALYSFFYFPTHGESRMAGLFLDAKDPRHFFPNAFASFLLIAWPLMLRNQGWKKFINILGISILLTALYFTFSRGAWLVFFIQIVAIAIFAFKKFSKTELLKILKMTGVIAVLISICIFTLSTIRSKNFTNVSVQEKVTFQNMESRTSLAERKDFWTGSLELIAEEPLKGFGPMSFRYAYPQVQKKFLAISDHPHNWLLKIAVENGLPAVIFFLFFLILVFRSLFSLSLLAPHFLLFIALLGGLLHNMVDYNMNFIPTIVIFFILSGSIIREKKSENLGNLGKISLSVWILIAAWTTVVSAQEIFITFTKRSDPKNPIAYQNSYIPRDYYLKEGLLDIHLSKNPLDARAHYEKGDFARALKLDPMNYFAYYRGNLDEGTVERVKKLLQEYEGLLSYNAHYTAFTTNPEEAAKIYEILGEPKKASEIRKKTARIKMEFAEKNDFGKALAPRTLW